MSAFYIVVITKLLSLVPKTELVGAWTFGVYLSPSIQWKGYGGRVNTKLLETKERNRGRAGGGEGERDGK